MALPETPDTVAVIVDVPAATPFARPALLTVALVVLLEIHTAEAVSPVVLESV